MLARSRIGLSTSSLIVVSLLWGGCYVSPVLHCHRSSPKSLRLRCSDFNAPVAIVPIRVAGTLASPSIGKACGVC